MKDQTLYVHFRAILKILTKQSEVSVLCGAFGISSMCLAVSQLRPNTLSDSHDFLNERFLLLGQEMEFTVFKIFQFKPFQKLH